MVEPLNAEPRPIRILKLGGSLLDWPGWPAALREWRATQPTLQDVMIVGGGTWADLVRETDARFSLGEETSHWLCLRLMSVTARLAHALLPESELVSSWAALERLPLAAPLTIVDCLPLIQQAEQDVASQHLPHCWAVTSDSIAAWLAQRLYASELVLLKSQLPPQGAHRAALASWGFVDSYFPIATAGLPFIRCVDLRSPARPDVRLPG